MTVWLIVLIKSISTGVLNGQDKEFNVLLQVSTLPVIISIGCGATIDMAKETAAKCVLNSIKKMLMFTSSSLALT